MNFIPGLQNLFWGLEMIVGLNFNCYLPTLFAHSSLIRSIDLAPVCLSNTHILWHSRFNRSYIELIQRIARVATSSDRSLKYRSNTLLAYRTWTCTHICAQRKPTHDFSYRS